MTRTATTQCDALNIKPEKFSLLIAVKTYGKQTYTMKRKDFVWLNKTIDIIFTYFIMLYYSVSATKLSFQDVLTAFVFGK